MIYSLVSVNSWFGFALLEFFNTKLKNVSCEYDRLNSCNSTSLELEKSGAPRPRSVSFAPLLRVRQHRAASSGSFHGHCRGGKRGCKRTHTSDNVPRNVRRQCYGGLFVLATLRYDVVRFLVIVMVSYCYVTALGALHRSLQITHHARRNPTKT